MSLEAWIASVTTSAASVVGTWMILRRRHSSDNKEIARDKADTSLISRLERRVDAADARADAADARADKAEAQLTELTASLRETKAENSYLQREMARLIADMRRRTRGLPAEIRRVVEETDYAPFDDRPQPPTQPPEKKT